MDERAPERDRRRRSAFISVTRAPPLVGIVAGARPGSSLTETGTDRPTERARAMTSLACAVCWVTQRSMGTVSIWRESESEAQALDAVAGLRDLAALKAAPSNRGSSRARARARSSSTSSSSSRHPKAESRRRLHTLCARERGRDGPSPSQAMRDDPCGVEMARSAWKKQAARLVFCGSTPVSHRMRPIQICSSAQLCTAQLSHDKRKRKRTGTPAELGSADD